MWQDIQYALRTFTRNPAFTLIAVVTLALGAGPNSAIFSIVNAVLLRPLPYRDVDRIVMLWETNKQRGFDLMPVSGVTFSDWKRDSKSFEEMAPAFTISEYGFNVTAGGEPERAQAGQAAANFFDVLGVRPVLGRTFLPEEDQPGGNPVVLISEALWTRRFARSPSIIGRAIGLDGRSRTVVGVLPHAIDSLIKVDLWIPIALNLAVQPRNNHQYGIMARLKPGVTAAQAQAEMTGIAKRLEQQFPATNAGMGALVIPINEIVAGRIRPALLVLLVSVGLLLLIACANVANLLLARGAAREKEIAVRVAMGASRSRILRQLLTESTLLGTAGGILGLLLATWSINVLRSQLPDVIPRLKEMQVDGKVLVFSLAVSVFTGVLFGIVPALRASRSNLNETLKEGGGKGVSSDTSQRARTVLLVAEVSLAVMLLIGAGLLVRSFFAVIAIDPGFRPENVLTMQLNLPETKYADSAQVLTFIKSLLRRVESLPGVRSGGLVNMLPGRGNSMNLRIFAIPFLVDGEPPAIRGQEPTADYRVITPGFIDAIGGSLRKGRGISDADTRDSQRVVLINEAMARRHFKGADPVGRRLRLPPFERNVRVIIGVIADMNLQGLEKAIDPAVFVPFEQNARGEFSLVVRGTADPTGLTAAIRREVLAIDGDQPVSDVRLMNQVVSDSLLVRRLSVWLLATFAILALALATVGIYGLTSYSVSRRTHEIGLRMALGAGAGDVLRLVVWRGIVTALVGVAIGIPGALFLSRLMRGLLFGVTTNDIATFIAAPLALVAVAALASYIPARRATRIDPIIALRYE